MFLSLEFDAPKGSKLYFNKGAKLKRKIEHLASDILIDNGFEEIITPHFFDSKTMDKLQKVIHIKSENNQFLSLRSDSTIEVLRLVVNRLSTEHKKWFYIQPIFLYPSTTKYQIGVEHIGNDDITSIVSILSTMLHSFEQEYVLQLSNIKIIHLLEQKYNIKKELFAPLCLEEVLNLKIDWLERLTHIHSLEDLLDLSAYPADIAKELERIKCSAETITKNANETGTNIVIEPLYYDTMEYYESLYFRAFHKNTLLARGGIYADSQIVSSGFAIYVDELMEELTIKEEK